MQTLTGDILILQGQINTIAITGVLRTFIGNATPELQWYSGSAWITIIGEAPDDGRTYGRKSQDWIQLTSGIEPTGFEKVEDWGDFSWSLIGETSPGWADYVHVPSLYAALQIYTDGEVSAVGRLYTRDRLQFYRSIRIGLETGNIANSAANVYIGNYAGRNQPSSGASGQVFVGLGAFENLSSTTAIQNTGIGQAAGSKLTSGSNNTLIGIICGVLDRDNANVTAMESGTMIGAGARPNNATTSDNEIVIGYNAEGYGSNTATIGNDNTNAIYFGQGRWSGATWIKHSSINVGDINCYGDLKLEGSPGRASFYIGTLLAPNIARGSGYLNNFIFGRRILYDATTATGVIAIGLNTLDGSTSVNDILALGNSAIQSISGDNVIALGNSAGRKYGGSLFNQTLCNNSIFLGVKSEPLANNQINQIVIGNFTIGKGSNTANIGDDNITDIYLGGGQAKVHASAIKLKPSTLPTLGAGDAGTIVCDSADSNRIKSWDGTSWNNLY